MVPRIQSGLLSKGPDLIMRLKSADSVDNLPYVQKVHTFWEKLVYVLAKNGVSQAYRCCRKNLLLNLHIDHRSVMLISLMLLRSSRVSRRSQRPGGCLSSGYWRCNPVGSLKTASPTFHDDLSGRTLSRYTVYHDKSYGTRHD